MEIGKYPRSGTVKQYYSHINQAGRHFVVRILEEEEDNDNYIMSYYNIDDKISKISKISKYNKRTRFIEITEEDYFSKLPIGHPDRIRFRKNRINKLLNES